MTIKKHDHYLDPPDEPEAKICWSCGHEMEFTFRGFLDEVKCVNPFCPDKHTGIAKEMAERIVELTEELEEYKLRVKVLKNKLGV